MATVQLPALVAQAMQQVQLDDILALTTLGLAGCAYATKGFLWNRPDPFYYKLYERPQEASAAVQSPQDSNDLAARLEQAEAEVAVLWASQSGTAEQFAARLAKDIRQHFGIKVICVDISEIDAQTCVKVQPTSSVIFLASTFGEGDPSDNMHGFWSWLQSDFAGTLSNMRFAAFGLGNSNYKHFNRVIKVLDDVLRRRGARPLLRMGMADDTTRQTEEHFFEWKEELLNVYERDLHYARCQSRYEPSYNIVMDSSLVGSALQYVEPMKPKSFSTKGDYRCLPIAQADNLISSAEERLCLHLEFDVSQTPQLKYKTGDYLSILPTNPPWTVDMLLQALGLDEERGTPVRIEPLNDAPTKVPRATTLEALFRTYLEICAPLSRETAMKLVPYAPTRSAKEYLEDISRDNSAFAKYVSNTYVNICTLLHAACNSPGAWSQLPLSLLVEVLPAMRPRHYSISSSSIVQPKRIAITATVAYTSAVSPMARVPGLATNYLLSNQDGAQGSAMIPSIPSALPLAQGKQIYLRVTKSKFKLPALASTPIVMVGTGSGLAPFRAFVQERARLKRVGKVVGLTKLFFGCRSSDEDCIYSEDFEEWKRVLGDSFELHTAFSRPADSLRRQHVQDVLEQQSENLADLLVQKNAYFYICGSAAMARDVSGVVDSILMHEQAWTQTESKDFAQRQSRQGRWMQDVWS